MTWEQNENYPYQEKGEKTLKNLIAKRPVILLQSYVKLAIFPRSHMWQYIYTQLMVQLSYLRFSVCSFLLLLFFMLIFSRSWLKIKTWVLKVTDSIAVA